VSKTHIKLTVNGREVDVLAEPRMLLIHVLREELNLTGAHIGCETSHCGACTVDMPLVAFTIAMSLHYTDLGGVFLVAFAGKLAFYRHAGS